ncbi:protein of unknown function [Candidatus Methylomirabilis oxygeniifera]|uniref:Uncharacterized protein n=1 Tax=Methylomirabilis oxygeniifera TaxID=671143 RepID=D5MF14_METO1|nr:protein of unknown function [Candidatus Methylomirabilis oxyfera]
MPAEPPHERERFDRVECLVGIGPQFWDGGLGGLVLADLRNRRNRRLPHVEGGGG